jgi:DNA-binding transcriptional LysR family regulator
MLDPRRLRVLREVATRGSFSAAAEALAFTQSAVSQQVAALERETGTRLVERGVRPVRLTDAGRALVAHAEAVLARLDEAQQELGEIARLRRGRLRLASFPTAIATLVPAAIARFNQRHPDVDVTVADDHQQGLLARLARWELDLALIYDHEALPEPEERLERTSLLDDPFDLVVPDGHRFAGGHRSPWKRSPRRPGSAAHRTAPMRASSSTAAASPGSSHA